MRVLIVDDENHITDGLAQLVDWGRLGVTAVDTAANGAQALSRYEASKPDLIVTDITMPVMNGLAFLERVRQTDPDTPAIILSGYDEFEYAKKALHLRVLHYVMKPIVLPEIEQILSEVIQKQCQEAKRKQYTEEFNRMVQSQLPALREQFLYKMVATGLRPRDISREQLKFYELPEEIVAGALLLTIGLYRTTERHYESERDWQLFKFSAMNIVQETLTSEPSLSAYPLQYMEDRLPILVCGCAASETKEQALRLATLLLDRIARFIGVEANAGIGRWYGESDKYGLSFKESAHMLRLGEHEGYQLTLCAGEEQMSGGEQTHSNELLRLLTEALARGDETESLRLWTDIERRLEADRPGLRLMQTASISMISHLLLGLSERGAQLPEGDALQSFRVFQDIQTARSREDVRRIIGDFVRTKLIEQRAGGREQASDYTAMVKNKVEAGYSQPLSFAQIAAELHLSRNYLGYVFKRETGVSFIQYLTQYRIERAKELMRTKRYLISEVAEKVGFIDAAYFSRVFRGATGKSPLEFVSELSSPSGARAP
ncbi:Two-component response regulator, YesN/AraC family, consists of REC and AraC-type DNA-binding domains [Paenibacillus sp. UNCCL117]|uniref:response regulator transcription factor n=1 Tax=unclassified Paenibacillus TaxID=185978 RepID=UPI0008895F49|nr:MULTISPECIES: response regulator [unclassified Paenibacillus]SDC28209.1 Two-component response regulator, YesN/AraC family, consists of REC and AraC-type DNA-binding domains [Paenibacillus sp. cl123]SFW20499.1 Two-component response regulator, YesN/AraC family, consists of REC and AraC-type DNA-binding domains [Paenibacillus sp. UNCCL117]